MRCEVGRGLLLVKCRGKAVVKLAGHVHRVQVGARSQRCPRRRSFNAESACEGRPGVMQSAALVSRAREGGAQTPRHVARDVRRTRRKRSKPETGGEAIRELAANVSRVAVGNEEEVEKRMRWSQRRGGGCRWRQRRTCAAQPEPHLGTAMPRSSRHRWKGIRGREWVSCRLCASVLTALSSQWPPLERGKCCASYKTDGGYRCTLMLHDDGRARASSTA